jgi:hypothetical protein
MCSIFFAVFLLPSTQAQDNSTSAKPVRQVTVAANEAVTAQTVVPRSSRPAATPAPQPAAQVQNVSNPAAAEDLARKSAEIVFLQRQIKEKQKRIELLMHLFVTDERQFVLSPTDVSADPTAQARLRQEQEELRSESAACARLQARLAALTAPPSHP